MSAFVDTPARRHARDRHAEEAARRRSVVFGLVLALIAAMLAVGAIATVVVALG